MMTKTSSSSKAANLTKTGLHRYNRQEFAMGILMTFNEAISHVYNVIKVLNWMLQSPFTVGEPTSPVLKMVITCHSNK